MTQTEELVAGRELDALVAEKVMGHRTWQERPDADYDTWVSVPTVPGTVEEWDQQDLPAYSTDIGAAWQVVEHLRTHGFAIVMIWPDHGVIGSAPWTVSLYGTGLPSAESIEADTAPLAICKAALAAVA